MIILLFKNKLLCVLSCIVEIRWHDRGKVLLFCYRQNKACRLIIQHNQTMYINCIRSCLEFVSCIRVWVIRVSKISLGVGIGDVILAPIIMNNTTADIMQITTLHIKTDLIKPVRVFELFDAGVEGLVVLVLTLYCQIVSLPLAIQSEACSFPSQRTRCVYLQNHRENWTTTLALVVNNIRKSSHVYIFDYTNQLSFQVNEVFEL